MYPIKPCPNCDAPATEREWRIVTAGPAPYATSLRLRIDATNQVGTDLQGLLCKRCGYVQFFVNQNRFSQKKDK